MLSRARPLEASAAAAAAIGARRSRREVIFLRSDSGGSWRPARYAARHENLSSPARRFPRRGSSVRPGRVDVPAWVRRQLGVAGLHVVRPPGPLLLQPPDGLVQLRCVRNVVPERSGLPGWTVRDSAVLGRRRLHGRRGGLLRVHVLRVPRLLLHDGRRPEVHQRGRRVAVPTLSVASRGRTPLTPVIVLSREARVAPAAPARGRAPAT